MKPKQPTQKDKVSLAEAKVKGARFCAYQERTQQEVRDKLYSYGLHQDEVEEALTWLITENFINEERFAKAFVGGKFRIKRWGRKKILLELKAKGLSDYCVKNGMAEIDPDLYYQNLMYSLEKKAALLKDKDPFVRNHKLSQFLLSKGYETDLVWDAIKSWAN